jgi:hypothetical protein
MAFSCEEQRFVKTKIQQMTDATPYRNLCMSILRHIPRLNAAESLFMLA